jgi:hypothetical protein
MWSLRLADQLLVIARKELSGGVGFRERICSRGLRQEKQHCYFDGALEASLLSRHISKHMH